MPKVITLEKEWTKLIEYARLHPYSVLQIEIKAGVPVMILKSTESIKLSD